MAIDVISLLLCVLLWLWCRSPKKTSASDDEVRRLLSLQIQENEDRYAKTVANLQEKMKVVPMSAPILCSNFQ
jgi:hypothetical protein